MALKIPDSFDTSYVQKILRNAEKDESIEISGLTAKAATATGDNYGSDMHRVTVEYSRVQDGRKIQETKNLIVKYAPYGDAREQLIENAGVFKTELSVLSEILPRMTERLEQLGQTTSLSAMCFHVQYEKPTHAIVEDLALRGFQMANRRAGLDLDHCSLALRNLARFHAASIALKEKDPMSVTKYNKGMFHKEQSDTTREFFKLGVKALAKETANWPELSPRIPEKILALIDTMYEKACDASLFQEDEFNVLNHGDFWINNMLFRYDERKNPIDHIFVDFQISNWGSPAIDLHYFFGTSPADDVRLHHRELLLREYHTSLSSTMAKLKCSTEVISFDKLQETLNRRFILEMVASMTILPIVLLEKGDEVNFDNLQNGIYDNPGYRGRSYRKTMTRLLPRYDSMGLLDV